MWLWRGLLLFIGCWNAPCTPIHWEWCAEWRSNLHTHPSMIQDCVTFTAVQCPQHITWTEAPFDIQMHSTSIWRCSADQTSFCFSPGLKLKVFLVWCTFILWWAYCKTTLYCMPLRTVWTCILMEAWKVNQHQRFTGVRTPFLTIFSAFVSNVVSSDAALKAEFPL